MRTANGAAIGMKKQEPEKVTSNQEDSISQSGDIGEEVLPTGISKNDKQAWNLAGNRVQRDSLFKRIVDWGTKEWGYK